MPSKLAFIEPANPVLINTPPTGAGWIHENAGRALSHDGSVHREDADQDEADHRCN